MTHSRAYLSPNMFASCLGDPERRPRGGGGEPVAPPSGSITELSIHCIKSEDEKATFTIKYVCDLGSYKH